MRSFALVGALCISLTPAFAETAPERLKDATAVFNEVMATPDKGIPQELLEKAHCAVIVPGMKSAAIGIGGKYGRGFGICRRPSGSGWGPPSAVRIEGGSVGFQIGATSTDVVMLVMNERGMKRLLESKFTLGGEAKAAAGPVGRSATAQTDAQMSAEILSWSRSKGLFAGVSLEGASLRNDLDENKELYAKPLTNKDVLMSNMPVPPAAAELVAALNRYSRREEGKDVQADRPEATKKTKDKVDK